MKVRLVTSLRQFDALASVWRDLTERSGLTSPLLSHDWFACSWRTAGPERRRELLIVEDTAGPVAFIPLVHSRTRVGGLPVRRMSLLSPPDTPFADFPIVGSVDEVLSTFLASLRDRRDWDVMSLVRLPARSVTYTGLQGVLPGQFVWRISKRDRSPYLTIAGGWDQFLARLSEPVRTTCQSIEEELRSCSDLTLEEHREVDVDGRIFMDAMEVFWAARGSWSRGYSTVQSVPRFLRELTRRASANGWLRLWIFRVNGRAVAAEYQLGSNGMLYALRREHDPSVLEGSAPRGLDFGLVRSLFEQGNPLEYDVGPASTSAEWASGAHERLILDVYARTTYGRVLHSVETRLLPTALRWRGGSESCA